MKFVVFDCYVIYPYTVHAKHFGMVNIEKKFWGSRGAEYVRYCVLGYDNLRGGH